MAAGWVWSTRPKTPNSVALSLLDSCLRMWQGPPRLWNVEQEAEKCSEAQRLRTHPGVGFSGRAGFRVNRRRGGAVPVRQTDCELSGTDAVGGVERGSATAGTHHQNKATRCYASYWWKRDKLRCAVTRNGAMFSAAELIVNALHYSQAFCK